MQENNRQPGRSDIKLNPNIGEQLPYPPRITLRLHFTNTFCAEEQLRSTRYTLNRNQHQRRLPRPLNPLPLICRQLLKLETIFSKLPPKRDQRKQPYRPRQRPKSIRPHRLQPTEAGLQPPISSPIRHLNLELYQQHMRRAHRIILQQSPSMNSS
jgi:hypothetical protein